MPFIKSSFIYFVKHVTMGLRILKELKVCVGLSGPTTIGLPFKSFGFKTFMMMPLSFCNIASRIDLFWLSWIDFLNLCVLIVQ